MRLGSLTREFDVLIKRAMRHGHLDIEEMVDCYLQIWPAEHPHANNPRKVDIATLIRLIETLPREIFYAPQIHLVADLQRMQHTPLASAAGLRTGLLADDTVLIEVSLGSSSVLHLTCHLCALQHEVDKALHLCPADDGIFVDSSVPEAPDIAATQTTSTRWQGLPHKTKRWTSKRQKSSTIHWMISQLSPLPGAAIHTPSAKLTE
ncbi:MAG: hypothetical protein R3C68_11975 [Myxococcota bacterium]